MVGFTQGLDEVCSVHAEKDSDIVVVHILLSVNISAGMVCLPGILYLWQFIFRVYIEFPCNPKHYKAPNPKPIDISLGE